MLEVLKFVNEYDITEDAEVQVIKKICADAEIELAEDSDNEEIIKLASFVAFGSFASWPNDIALLAEAFKKEGVYRPL